MPTIQEVLRSASVSPSKGIRVLIGSVPVTAETRQRGLDPIEELDYRPSALTEHGS